MRGRVGVWAVLVGAAVANNASNVTNGTNLTTLVEVEHAVHLSPPSGFVEGQEVRAEFSLKMKYNATQYGEAVNMTDNGTAPLDILFEVSGYGAAAGVANCTLLADDPSTYPPLFTASEYGNVTALANVACDSECEDYELAMLHHAHATFLAPANASGAFHLCFRYTLPQEEANYTIDNNGSAVLNHTWMNARHGEADEAFAASRLAGVWYHLPEPTTGQYAVMQLLSHEDAVAFSYPNTSCIATGQCVEGDSLKIVPRGSPCTYEVHPTSNDVYYGTGGVDNGTGHWTAAGAPGLAEGAVAGGVGAFGTQFANPLVDTWTAPGNYSDVNDVGLAAFPDPPGGETGGAHAYVYVRIPSVLGGEYDVCYSSQAVRKALAAAVSIETPVWRKLPRCVDAEACAAAQAAGGAAYHFAVGAEPVGWSMGELVEGTVGEIVFDDSGEAQLSNEPATHTAVPASAPSSGAAPAVRQDQANFWAPAGGDHFILQPSDNFEEVATTGRNPNTLHVQAAIQRGSYAAVGCWSGAGTVEGLMNANPTVRARASTDLMGDPTSAAAQHDARFVAATFSALPLPKEESGAYIVCYRRTCNAAESETPTCKPHSGWRVLPFHKASRGAVPPHWLHLENVYTPGDNAGTVHALVAGSYGGTRAPPVQWYVNDTAAGTWGPVLIEQTTAGAAMNLDSRRWTFYQDYAPGATVASDVVGGAIRLVPNTRPCSYNAFGDDAAAGRGLEMLDGGSLECNSLDATNETVLCAGRHADYAQAMRVAYYIVMPAVGATYKVCHRHRGANWRTVLSVAVPTTYTDTLQPEPSWTLDREWVAGQLQSLTPTAPTVSIVDMSVDDRTGGAIQYLVHDSKGRLIVAPGREWCDEGCTTGGDVLRLVPEGQRCDITPTSYDPIYDVLVDALKLYCPVEGAGEPALSGLTMPDPAGGEEATPCALSNFTKEYCASDEGCTSASPYLQGLLVNSPDVFDDMVPEGSDYRLGHTHTAATVRLPPPPSGVDELDGAGNVIVRHARYTLCYRPAASWHWSALASVAVQPGMDTTLHSPVLNATLLGGSLQRLEFSLDLGAAYPRSVHTKFVPFQRGRRDLCVLPAADTENAYGGASTDRFSYDTETRRVALWVPVPQRNDFFAVCALAVDAAGKGGTTWWRVGSATEPVVQVADTFIRWYARKGARPVNGGVVEVNFVRCAYSNELGADCRPGATNEVFNLAPGADAAKVVRSSDECGFGRHVDALGRGASAEGVTDLSPGDGVASRAAISLTLPTADGDAAQNYRVCVKTNAPGDYQQTQWFEVEQAPAGAVGDPAQIYLEFDGESRFQTLGGLIGSWGLAEELTPAYMFYPPELTGAVAVAGVGTQFVNVTGIPAGNGSIPATPGFFLNAHANLSSEHRALITGSDEFKLVRWKQPLTAEPPDQTAPWGWTESWLWTDIGLDCNADGVEGASTGDAEVEACQGVSTPPAGTSTCPHLVPPNDTYYAMASENGTVAAAFQMPFEPGMYMVCWRGRRFANVTEEEPRPWQLIPAAAGGAYPLYTHTSYLAASVAAGEKNVTVRDARTSLSLVNGTATVMHAASWCGAPGVGCGTQAFTHDLFTIVHHARTCPPPESVVAGPTSAPPWYPMRALTGETDAAVVDSATAGAFALPPTGYRSPAGHYKLCVFKAAQADALGGVAYAEQVITRAGAVYQVRVQEADLADPAGRQFWVDTTGAGRAVALTVKADVVYNASTHFVGYTGDPDAMAAYYGNETRLPRDSLVHNETGQFSHVPLLRSGVVVAYTVSAVSASGWVVPSESFEIDVMRCRRSYNWEGLECVDPVQEAPDVHPGAFSLQGIGGACDPATAPQYGWLSAGLRQTTGGGVARFMVQYTSGCPPGGFGCGIRFRGRGPTSVLTSPAQWINTLQYHPEQVSVDGRLVAPRVSPDPPFSAVGCAAHLARDRVPCYMKTCESGRACSLVISAFRTGETLYAPIGGVRVIYSAADYAAHGGVLWDAPPTPVRETVGASVSANGTLLHAPWGHGGVVVLSFTPVLNGAKFTAADDAYVYLNVTMGDYTPDAWNPPRMWTRVVVRITRPALATLAVKSLAVAPYAETALRGTGRVAPPVFVGAVNEGGDTFTASQGSYLEALVPYTLEFDVKDAEGAALPVVPGVLRDFTIRGQVDASARLCLVLKTHAAYDENFITTPNRLEKFVVTGTEALTPYSLRFRLYVADNTCSRFAPLGGCRISFTFQNVITAEASMITLVTPVRVPAATLFVDVVGGVPERTTVREGLEVQLLPGSFVNTQFTSTQSEKVVYDDFHHGDAFALVDDVDPRDRDALPTEGGRGRYGVSVLRDEANAAPGACAFTAEDAAASETCAVYKYAMKELPGVFSSRWGARFTLRPSKPCLRCAFTFHTTWGAGPESYNRERRAADGARLEDVTFTQEPMALRCTQNISVAYPYGGRHTEPFDIDVAAVVPGVAGAPSAVYPRSWAFIDGRYFSTDIVPYNKTYTWYRLRKLGEEYELYRERLGDGAAARFTNFALRAPNPPNPGTTEYVMLRVHSMMAEYGLPHEWDPSRGTDALWSFAEELGSKTLSCDVYVTIEAEPAPSTLPTEQRLRVVGAAGAEPMCAGAGAFETVGGLQLPVPDCGDWVTTTEALQEGVTFDVRFVEASRVRDFEDARWRNVTIVPGGGPLSSPDAAVDWYYNDTSETYHSSSIYLDSTYNPPEGIHLAGAPYSFGGVWVAGEIARPDIEANTTTWGGNASVTFRYGFGAIQGATRNQFAMDAKIAPVTPVRHAVFELCDATWINATEDDVGQVTPGYSVTGTVCRSVNLWVRQARAAPQLAILDATAAGEVRRGVGGCTGGGAVSLEAIAYYKLPAGAVVMPEDTGPSFGGRVTREDRIRALIPLRYPLYDVPLEYSVAVPATVGGQAVHQRLVPAERGVDGEFNATLRVRNAVPLPGTTPGARFPSLVHTLTTDALRVGFSFFGMDVFDVPSPVVLSAAPVAAFDSHAVDALSNGAGAAQPPALAGAIPSVPTPGEYVWKDGAEGSFRWSVEPRVELSEDCPARRVLPTASDHYQTYEARGTPPGDGWSYSSSGLRVGIPTPIVTVVQHSGGQRAWGFADGTLVRVQKRNWLGCNNGGELSVYSMRPARALEYAVQVSGGLSPFSLSGSGETGWVPGDGGAVPTSGGVAVPWVVFAEPCAHCTLQLDLCYPGASPEMCQDRGAGGAGGAGMNMDGRAKSRVYPVSSERTQVTKPFAVEYPKLDALMVVEQQFPHQAPEGMPGAPIRPAADHPVYVGDMFTVRVAGVQLFAGKWAMHEPSSKSYTPWAKRLWVTTDYATGAENMLHYGNGGYVGDAANRVRRLNEYNLPIGTGCGAALDAQEYLRAGVKPTVELGEHGEVRFYFARPCGGCRVKIHYELSPSTAAAPPVAGAFHLRHYDAQAPLIRPGAAAAFLVQTCGVGWVFAGRPAPLVRKRRAFAVTLLLVDTHEARATVRTAAPAFAGNFAGDDAAKQAVPYRPLPGMGNGAGGTGARVTTPLTRVASVNAATPAWHAPFSDPSAPEWVRQYSGGVGEVRDEATGLPLSRWPGEAEEHATVIEAVEGSATVRLWYPRACYQCGVALGQAPDGRPNYYLFSVVADPAQIVAIPDHTFEESFRDYSTAVHAAAPARWHFEVYVADDDGDRAYEVGGPTEPALRPSFRTPRIGAAGADSVGMKLTASATISRPAVLVAAVDTIDPPIELVLNTGADQAYAIAVGTTFHNGMPLPLARHSAGERGAPGALAVELAAPGTGYELAFELSKDNPTTAGGAKVRLDLPTYVQRGDERLRGESVSLSLQDRTSHMAVDDVTKTVRGEGRCTVSGNPRGEACYFDAYMIGSNRSAGIPNPNQDVDVDDFWFRCAHDSTLNAGAEGSITVHVSCCPGTAKAAYSKISKFSVGQARTVIDPPTPKDAFADETCTCSVAVEPPKTFPLAKRLAFSVTFDAEPVPTVWVPASSGTMHVRQPEADAAAAATAGSIAGARVAIGYALSHEGSLAPYESLTLQEAGGDPLLRWQTDSVILDAAQMTPPGCFTCEGGGDDGANRCLVAISRRGTYVAVHGTFASAGRCEIGAGAFAGFQSPTEFQGQVARGLAVDVGRPAGVELHYNVTAPQGAESAFFTGLEGRTAEGHPAAVVGTGAVLRLRVVDELQQYLEGDHHTTVAVEGYTLESAQRWPFPDAPFQVRRGTVAIHLDAAHTTRTPACDAHAAAAAAGPIWKGGGGGAATTRAALKKSGCAHDPWWFAVTARNVTGDEVAALTVGPLFFVRSAARLLSFASIGTPCGEGAAGASQSGAPSAGDVELPTHQCVPTSDIGDANRTVAEIINAGWAPLVASDTFKAAPGAPERTLGMQPRQAATAARHPAMWGLDVPFDMLVVAVDRAGHVVHHPEDVGSEAWWRVEGVGAPCSNIDALEASQYYAKTCLDTEGLIPPTSSCRYTAFGRLPACALTSPRVPGAATPGLDFQLRGGALVLPAVSYSPSGGAAEGVAQFTLEAGLGWPARGPRAVLHELYLHRTAALELVTRRGVICNETARTCDMSAALAPRPGEAFGWDVAMTDAAHLVVASDSASRVAAFGACRSGESAFLGRVRSAGLPDYVTPPVWSAERGVAQLAGMVVNAPCLDFAVTLSCEGDACLGLSLVVNFTVGDDGVPAPPTPAPDGGGTPAPTAATPGPTSVGYDALDINGLVLDEAASVEIGRELIAELDPVGMSEALEELLHTGHIKVVDAVTPKCFCVLPRVDNQRFSISPFQAADPSVCIPASLLPLEGNATLPPLLDDGPDARGADELQLLMPYHVFAWFEATTAIPVDAAVLSEAVAEVLRNDLSAEASTLREASGFERASSSALAVGVPDTPEPQTPIPRPPTPAPPTSVPPTPAPPTPLPSTWAPLPLKGIPLTFAPTPQPPAAGGGRAVGGVWAAVAAVGVAMLVCA